MIQNHILFNYPAVYYDIEIRPEETYIEYFKLQNICIFFVKIFFDTPNPLNFKTDITSKFFICVFTNKQAGAELCQAKHSLS